MGEEDPHQPKVKEEPEEKEVKVKQESDKENERFETAIFNFEFCLRERMSYN